MRLFLVAGLFAGLGVAGSAQPPGFRNGHDPVHARTCPKLAQQPKPGERAKAYRLNQLPPGEVYAAVYYLDGCPRRLVEAQGKRHR